MEHLGSWIAVFVVAAFAAFIWHKVSKKKDGKSFKSRIGLGGGGSGGGDKPTKKQN